MTHPAPRSDVLAEHPVLRFAHRHRVAVTRWVAISLVPLLLLSHHSWPEESWLDTGLHSFGLLFISVAAIGRLWANLYILGRKSSSLVTVGPYAMVRNPLYLFSLVGAIGLGLASENLLVGAILVALFGGFYPIVMLAEELRLASEHGALYREYASRVPRLFPRPGCAPSAERPQIDVRGFGKGLCEALCWPTCYIALELMEAAQNHALVPVLWTMP